MAENKQLGVILLVAAAGLAFWRSGTGTPTTRTRSSDKITTVQLAAGHADIKINVSDDDQTTRPGAAQVLVL